MAKTDNNKDSGSTEVNVKPLAAATLSMYAYTADDSAIIAQLQKIAGVPVVRNESAGMRIQPQPNRNFGALSR